MDWDIPLIVVAIVFGALMVWKVRPAILTGRRRVTSEELTAAHARIEAAKDDASRAIALCDAGDIAGAKVGGRESAVGLYLRAMRADPNSEEIVRRIAKALEKRPRALESVLWRHLGAAPWTGAGAKSARAALAELAHLYKGPLRNAPRARALDHAAEALDAPAAPRDG